MPIKSDGAEPWDRLSQGSVNYIQSFTSVATKSGRVKSPNKAGYFYTARSSFVSKPESLMDMLANLTWFNRGCRGWRGHKHGSLDSQIYAWDIGEGEGG